MWKTKFDSHDDSDLIKERDTYKQKWNNYIDTQKDSFKSFFEAAKESEAWGKVSNEYKIPDSDGGWEKLSTEDIENNVSKMQYHKKLGLFDHTPAKPNPPTNKPLKFDFNDETPLTAQEYHKLRMEKGPDSPEARRAMELIKKYR
jgi:hypothetical protein